MVLGSNPYRDRLARAKVEPPPLPMNLCSLRSVVLVSAVSLFLAADPSPANPINLNDADVRRPNIVLIITDDQGYGDLSCHGNPILETPHLEALHASSLRLTNYHVSPTCAPTRGALMSGHYTNRAGPWHTIKGRSYLRTTSLSFGEIFSAHGYATGMFGKWHLGDNYPYRPWDRGFTEVVSHGAGGVGQTPDHWDNAYFDDTYWHNGKPRKFTGYCTDVFFQEGMRFMRESVADGKPFLAYISTNAPHSPFICAEKYWKPYVEKGLSETEAIFFGMIANIDENVGRLVKFLEDEQLTENTIFIFTTDNGTATGEKVFNAGMRGRKASAYEGGHRVPFFVRWPAGGLTEARDIDTLTAHIDILPTFLELCGLEAPLDYSFDGRSLVPLLYKLPTSWPDRTLITDSQRVTDPIKWKDSATMTQRWRLIDGKELYEIESDPDQTSDISAEHPDVVTRLRADYDAWWASISPSFAVATRIVVGNPAENPSILTAHDWITDDEVTPWHQTYIRKAKPGTGTWYLEVEESGRYEIALSRWHPDLQLPINATLPPGDPVPGTGSFRDAPGLSIQAHTAVLEIGGVKTEQPVRQGEVSVRFTVELEAGAADLKGTFLVHGSDQPLGTYYARVRRL